MMWVLPNPGFMGGLSWPKFILLLKGQVLWGCATTGADTRNVWGMCDWQGGGMVAAWLPSATCETAS